jgi:Adenine-specific DNA methylase containing a Zn-ribbon
VIFSSLVDDPSAWPELFPTEEEQEKERERIFRIIEELVIWENSNNPGVLLKAHTEIARSLARGRNEPLPEGADAIRAYIAEHAPPLYDPFCGGGSIPLEAQRLGLKAYASDLNPVAVLITKALIEIPPKFAGMPPVNPESRKNKKYQGDGKEQKDWPKMSGITGNGCGMRQRNGLDICIRK